MTLVTVVNVTVLPLLVVEDVAVVSVPGVIAWLMWLQTSLLMAFRRESEP